MGFEVTGFTSVELSYGAFLLVLITEAFLELLATLISMRNKGCFEMF